MNLQTFQSKWISLLNDPEESFYGKRMTMNKQIPRKKSKVKDVAFNPWPLSEALPDMVCHMQLKML